MRIKDKELREQSILLAANYCIEYKWTIREIAENMCISKSTIHRWLTEDLKFIDAEKYQQCKRIMERRII